MEKEKLVKSIPAQFLKKNWLLLLVVIYVISPVDFVPDAIPIVGKLDDSALLLIDLIKSYLDFKKTNEKVKP